MTSKEVFEKVREILEQHHHQFVKDDIKLETIEGYPINKIEKDLEVLEILKRIVKIVDYSECPIDSLDNQLVILSGGRIMNVEDYDKIKEWLENE